MPMILLWLACAWVTDEEVAARFDADADGHEAPRWGGDDCDDTDPDAHPGAPEVWYDGVDADCDDGNDYDQDGDGVLADVGGGTDCEDVDPEVFPGAPELQNGKDDDCDGQIDEVPTTTDLDGDGWSEADGDCDDADPDVNPDADEVFYDGTDQNCDPTDEYDRDADGYDAESYGGTDCDDSDASVHPGATEALDGIDSDCDGLAL